MMEIILYLYDGCRRVVAASIPLSALTSRGLFEKLIKIKYDIPNNRPELFEDYKKEIDTAVAELLSAGGAPV